MRRHRRPLPVAIPLALLVAALLAIPQARTAVAGIWGRITHESTAAPESLRVRSVADGDTLTVETASGRERVRVLGVNAPEVAHDGNPAQCGGVEAQRFARAQLDGQRVTLTTSPGTDDRDRYGRLLRYVEVNGHDYGRALLDAGLAREYVPRSATQPDRAGPYRAAESHARKTHAGMWHACGADAGAKAPPK